MSNYIITGGDGFIGSKIVTKTYGRSFDIKSGNSILDAEKIEAAARGVKGIFHCAAKISVPESVEFPDAYYETNVTGFAKVIEAAQHSRASIVFSSSAAVYGEYPVPVAETADLHPKSPYAENKRDGEELLRSSGLPSIALRYFNVYGPGQSAQYAGVISFFIRAALKNEDLIIYGDGKQVRDFIYVDDVVSANIKAMEYADESFEVFNIGNSEEITINDLAKMITRLTNSRSKIIYKPARVGDIVYSQSDSSKARKMLGWKPTVSLEEGLRRTVESMK